MSGGEMLRRCFDVKIGYETIRGHTNDIDTVTLCYHDCGNEIFE